MQGPHVSLSQELETLHVILLSANQIGLTVCLLANTVYGEENWSNNTLNTVLSC